jgi:diacylglycerol kinase family enzyme
MNKFKRLVAVHSPTSSRAAEYAKKVLPKLQQIAAAQGAKLIEISLNKVPYFTAVQMVREVLADGDVVFGAGGDGVNQITLQGAYEAAKNVVVGFLPLGNANDFTVALNGRVKDTAKILSSQTIDFYPLELTINRRLKFYVAAYATLGITTVAVDWLNSEAIRNNRQRLPNLSPVAALGAKNFRRLSQAINQLRFPTFRRDSLIHHDDSVGFFLTSAAKGLLRPEKSLNFLNRDNFFFHFAKVRGKSLASSWLGKSLIAGRWAAFGLPGAISDYEKLEFLQPSDIAIHVGGDVVPLAKVQTITAERAKNSLKLFAPRVKSLQS